ncbi:hypothetical protein VCHA53O466_320054 [Vibrio chagasii]|nr:hypothetical protein VCHA53O466_320054 [Vibrio chagasii]
MNIHKLEFIVRNLGEHNIAVGHITSPEITSDFFARSMWYGKISECGKKASVTISKESTADIKDAYGYELDKGVCLESVVRADIWAGYQENDMRCFGGYYTFVDNLLTANESDTNRALFASVITNTAKLTGSNGHAIWRSVAAHESTDSITFEMEDCSNNCIPSNVNTNEAELDAAMKGMGVLQMLRDVYWTDMTGEQFVICHVTNMKSAEIIQKLNLEYIEHGSISEESKQEARDNYAFSAIHYNERTDRGFRDYLKHMVMELPQVAYREQLNRCLSVNEHKAIEEKSEAWARKQIESSEC